ncbi:MAG: hypothetical protein IKR06_00540 [Erysipelotrichaceae bacterium]|nr:hypothetical protein [Erysipelotrichaceae bacterium]MBR4121760.1 hypothetical protein [Erysipelotrichaceae bacterium]
MRTEQIRVSSSGEGMEEALQMTEKFGLESGLIRKEDLRLRLLAEELFGMMRSIVGKIEALYWIEGEDQKYDIFLAGDVELNQDSRRKLIEVSSKHENAAAKGFMGKLRDMIGVMLLPEGDGPSMTSIGLMTMGSPNEFIANSDAYSWSLNKYREELQASDNEEARKENDELERSIVASLADEVSVSIEDSKVTIVVTIAF